MGLMQGLEIVKDRKSKEPDPSRVAAVMEATKAERLLIGTGGLWGHVLRIAPSMLKLVSMSGSTPRRCWAAYTSPSWRSTRV